MLHAQGIIPVTLTARDTRVAIIGSRWNQQLTDSLVEEAEQLYQELGGTSVKIIRVPGAFELPLAILYALLTKKFDAIVALGVIIEGATPHFEKLCTDVTERISSLIIEYRTPIGFGVVMAHTMEQAAERCGKGAANKGREAMAAALEMIYLRDLIK